MPILYHSVEPESNRDVFQEHNSVDFIINSDRNLVRNSIRIEGVLKCKMANGAQVAFTDRVHLNKRIGVHSIIESSQVQINGAIIENINTDYSRFVHMIQSSTKSRDEYYDSGEICELKAVSTDVACAIASGETTRASSAAQGDYAGTDFSFRPMICLNRADNDVPLARLNNEVRLSFNLARDVNVLCGVGQEAGGSYEITQFRLTYRTTDPVAVPSVGMKSVFPIKQIVNTSSASINSRVPAICNAVSVSFLRQTKENQIVTDNNALEQLPQLDQVQYMFNDATNQLVQYQQEEYSEYLGGFLDSLNTAGIHSVSPNAIKGNSVFGLGLKFGAEVDLSNQKFGVQVVSAASQALSYIMYLYFHSSISI